MISGVLECALLSFELSMFVGAQNALARRVKIDNMHSHIIAVFVSSPHLPCRSLFLSICVARLADCVCDGRNVAKMNIAIATCRMTNKHCIYENILYCYRCNGTTT